jgi:uncharacterized protein DUF6328/uncharacterized protein DUF5709
MDPVAPDDLRGERPAQRADRNFTELLQELRVTQIGVQILFAFLLGLAFTPRFTSVGATDRVIYVVTLLCSALTTCLLITPVAAHRLWFQRRRKAELVQLAHGCLLAGLAALLLTMVGAVLLVLDMVMPSASVALTALLAVFFTGLWFVLPRLHPPLTRPASAPTNDGEDDTMSQPDYEPQPEAADLGEVVQEDTGETLVGPSDSDVLDAGYIPPDRPYALSDEDKLTRNEDLDSRLHAERPDVSDDQHEPPNPPGEPGDRAPRLAATSAAPDSRPTDSTTATGVGVDAGAATAEEAAVHVADEEDEPDSRTTQRR